MATWVVDASVILKWLLADARREADTAQAADLIEATARGQESILQPPQAVALQHAGAQLVTANLHEFP